MPTGTEAIDGERRKESVDAVEMVGRADAVVGTSEYLAGDTRLYWPAEAAGGVVNDILWAAP